MWHVWSDHSLLMAIFYAWRECEGLRSRREEEVEVTGVGVRNKDGTRREQNWGDGKRKSRRGRRREKKEEVTGWALGSDNTGSFQPVHEGKVRLPPNCAFWALAQARGCLMDSPSKRATCAAVPEPISPNQPTQLHKPHLPTCWNPRWEQTWVTAIYKTGKICFRV